MSAAADKTLSPLHIFGAFEHVCEESHGACCGGDAFAKLAHGKLAYGGNGFLDECGFGEEAAPDPGTARDERKQGAAPCNFVDCSVGNFAWTRSRDDWATHDMCTILTCNNKQQLVQQRSILPHWFPANVSPAVTNDLAESSSCSSNSTVA